MAASVNSKKFKGTGRKHPLLVGVDLDGVIIDHTEHFLRECGKRGYKLRPWQVNSNVLGDFLPGDLGGVIKRVVYERLRGASSIMPGALAALRNIADRAVIVSVQKKAESEKIVWSWLKRHGILDVIPRSRIHILRSRTAKLRRIAKLKPDIFIDDGLDVLEFLPKGTLPVLFCSPEPRKRLKFPARIASASNWNGVLRILRHFSIAPRGTPRYNK